ncbi:hypothetical protein [Phycicoccus sp. DTK01]|uniref:hypothetical protein n=1 Tax=Phycicoccus sp. DTK01 TaxID=2785745 RepID=UPI001A8C3F84|nr:hypothetical protein [Phycicoccus sp. DTK01]GIL34185.1 hypothetical protein PDTK01_02620 [Phycicoccus sp. DTK01]
MTAQRWHEDVGSVAEEAGRLLESLRRAGRDSAADAGATGAPAAGDTGADDTRTDPPAAETFSCDDPVCQWCPVCRASAFVRQLSPETLGTLAELAGFAAAVLGDLASARGRAHDDQQGGDRG